jgi:PKD repeat protein
VIKVPQPPQAVLEGPTTGKIGQSLAFDGSESFDIDGQISHYSWNFGDGMMADGPQVTHTYLAEGDYRVTLTVIDDDNLTTSTSQLVQIAPPIQVNLSPTAIISGPAIAQISQTITFDGSRSFDSDGQIVSYFWEFGDGQKARGPQVDHTYKAEGDYEVWLTVADDGGLTATVFQIIRVIPPMQVNPPPALPL